MRGKFNFKRQLTFLLAIMMLLTAVPVNLLAQSVSDDNYSIKYNDNILRREDYINKVDKLPLIAAKSEEGQTSKVFAQNPKQPERYTVRADFKVERGDDYIISYQPYIATVGEAASDEEKAKVNKELNFPVFDGYTSATKKTTVDYNFVKERALRGKKIEDPDLGIEKKGPFEAIYKPIESTVLVKHVFQDFVNPEIYKEKPGDEPGHFRETTQTGVTGTSLKIQPLSDYEIEGYVPESNDIRTQVPENPKNFEVEFRYNRASYDLIYDTDGGTLIPARRVYYKQVVPTLEASEIPTKVGAEFIGWTASHDIITKGGKEYKTGEIIADALGNPIKNLDAELLVPALRLGNNKRPAEKLVFKAAWKNNPTADYAVQFWVEKADHADNVPLLNKYDFMGTRVYKNAKTGSIPNLDAESVGPVNKVLNGVTNTFPGLKFPDLDEARLKKIWNGAKFYGDQYLYLNKFFVYNKELTDELNYEPIDPNNINASRKIKEIMSDGRTVYNIYYDRQVYDLYFTKSNALPDKETFYPEIYVPDGNGGAKLAGGPGNPYHYKARFNELMLGWPNDAMQTKGFDPGKQSYGWGPNYGVPHWPLHLDTPPYRLNADEFLDMPNYEDKGGYVSKIDNGAGGHIIASDFRTLSFGIKQESGSMPHHMDFWMDGFKDGETIIRYDLYRSKADTNSLTYNHRYTQVQGFTPKGSSIVEKNEENGRITEDDIDTLNDERGEITPYPDKEYTDIYGFNNALGQMHFRAAFFNNADGFGDPLEGEAFKENGYIRFKYYRNKYPLRFNFDPSITRDDSYFNNTNKLDTFYEFPLKVLSPNLVKDDLPREKKEYFKKNPDNFLDKPNNLFKLGLTDLLQRDPDNPSKFAQETIKFKNPVTNEEENYTTYKVRRPDGLPPQMEFKGWALDPAGTKLIWKLKGETMPSHPLNLYAKWGEPDYKWKITFDPNEGKMPDLIPKTITKEEKTIKEGDIGLEKEETYPKAGYKDENGKETPAIVDGKKIFTVVQRQKLVPPETPTREGYEFMGWELVRFKKDNDGKLILDNNGKPVIDTSYRDKYKVPELYAFENDVVSDLYLRAIWNKNDLINIVAYHHYLDNDFKEESMDRQILKNRRVGSYVGAVGSRQDARRILVPKDEWDILEENNTTEIAESMTYSDYKKLDPNNPRVNSYYQQIVVQPLKKEDKATGQLVPNPEAKYNVFHYYYRPFRKRQYKVNYVDARAKDKIETIFEMNALNKEIPELGIKIKRTSDKTEKKKLEDIKAKKEERLKELEKIKPTENLETLTTNYAIINKETVTNGNRDFDARNYRHIPGWKLVGKPQQQLFFDVEEESNKLIGINGTGMDEIYFFYKDIRVIESKKGDPVPDGYVRITYKIDDKNKGGTFVDKDGKKVTELYYDVIKGLRSDNLDPITPKVWVDGEKNLDGTEKTKEEGKFYITADNGKNFIKWDQAPLLNKDTVLEQNYTFTAYFDWSDVAPKPMVRTEALNYTGTENWSNKFAPTIEQLKKQIIWRVKGQEKSLPDDATVYIEGTLKENNSVKTVEAKSDEEINKIIYEKVKELGKTDTKELVRTVNIKAYVKFKDEKDIKELDIPVKVYKNVYEALTNGEMPKVLKDATDDSTNPQGDLVHVTGNYVKVTVAPTGNLTNKDNKIYYVNPKAWVEIPEVSIENDEKTGTGFIKWAADKDAQNEDGIYDFAKRHKFTEDTVISPKFSNEVVEQTDPAKKPDVPDTFVKVIVKTTDKATDETAFEKTFWVNPTKEVTIPVTNPTGKTVKADPTKPGTLGYTMNFDKWTSNETTPRTWEDKIVGKFEKETTIEAKYSINFENIKDIAPKTDTVHTAKGKTPTADEIKDKLTPPEGKTIKEVKIVQEPNVDKEGPAKVKVTVEYTDGSSVGTNDDPIEIPVEVHKNIIPEAPGGERPKDALDNYVKVILKAGEGGKFEKTLTNQFVYYVSPDVEADMTEEADKIQKTPDTGYIVNGGTWTPEIKSEKITAEKTYVFNFKKSIDIVEKTPQVTKAPDGYVTVTFKAEENGKYGKLEGNIVEKVYYVNPKAGIKLGKTAAEKVIQVPQTIPAANYVFDKWFEAIDDASEITSDRIHVAKFKSDKVTLTYEAGEGTGTAPIRAIVDYGTSVRLASPDGLTKADAKFLGWKLDGDSKTYKPGELIKLEKSRTATAQWESDKPIISYDPVKNPTTKPEGYIRVSFVAENGLKLDNVKYYYVKKNAKDELGNPITLAKLTKPTVTAETGYKSIGWDKDNSVEIKDQDITVKALSEGLDDAIDKSTNPNKPKGYVEVKFVAGPNGTVDEKTYFVNPNKYVSLTPPTATGNTGYEFNTWSSDKVTGDFSLANFIKYDSDTTITANFNQKDSFIPKKPGVIKPAGYVEVNFVVENASATKGTILGNQITTYYVDPSREVALDTPETMAGVGYMFEKWYIQDNGQEKFINPKSPNTYGKDTTIYARFMALGDVIPLINDDGSVNLQPDGYVQVYFLPGSHAKAIGVKNTFFVNPNKDIEFGALPKPQIIPDTGWKLKTGLDAWLDANDMTVPDNTKIKDYMYLTAQYEAIPDVVPQANADGSDRPENYVTVTFEAGDHGSLTGNKVYYVNPDKYVRLPSPETHPATGFKFTSWDKDIRNYTIYNTDTTITANFDLIEDVVAKTRNDDSERPANFVKVSFVLDQYDGKDAASIKAGEITTYFVNPAKAVAINLPELNINEGYEFDKWVEILDQGTKQEIKPHEKTQYTKDTVIHGTFTKLQSIIPAKEISGAVNPKPDGYVTVTFDKGDNGLLVGNTIFYVNPSDKKKLGDIDRSNIKVIANNAYKHIGWDREDTLVIEGDITVTAKYESLKSIIKAEPDQTAPAGYVVVIFKTDGKGTIKGNTRFDTDKTLNDKTDEIVYFVNPKDHVKLAQATETATDTILPVPETFGSDTEHTVFSKWIKDIDTSNEIIRGRVYVATFNSNEVSLTYEANGATGDVPAVTTVDYGKTLRLAGPGNLKKENASFAGWMIDGRTYQVGEEVTLTKDTKAVAKWNDDAQIIEYDPINKPMTKPDDTYLRVNFTSDDGITLNETKAYYVKKNTKLSELTMPRYTLNTGYDFKEWTPKNITEITTDITFKATSTAIADTIEKTDPNQKAPAGYKEVKFVAGPNGTVDEKTYFVNPNKYVTLTPPTATGKTGYEFGAWSDDATKPTAYTGNKTITASFNKLDDKIAKDNNKERKKPDGYKTVKFVVEEDKGSILNGENTVYYVKPNTPVSIEPPKTSPNIGFEPVKWDKDTTTATEYTNETTIIKGTFAKINDIVEAKKEDGTVNPKPDGYVTVTFISGKNGTLYYGSASAPNTMDKKVYYVNPKTKKLEDLIKPKVKPDTGFEQKEESGKFVWDILGDTNYKDELVIDKDMIINAEYTPLDDVVPKTRQDESEKPAGYIEVTFKTTDKAGNVEKTVYVNPNKAVELKDKAPAVTPGLGYEFAGWDRPITETILYKDKEVITAQFNEIGNVIPQKNTDGTDKPTSYFTVTFLKGDNGKELSGQTVYYVKPNTPVTVTAPKVTAQTGYKFKTWDQELKQTFTADTTITAQYDPIADVVPQENPDGSDKPDGYVKVTFDKGEHGNLEEEKVYFVNPTKEVTLVAPGVIADLGYKFANWDQELTKTFASDTRVKAKYDELDPVVPEYSSTGSKNDKPSGYVEVKLIPTDNATDDTKEEKIYFVNPSVPVTITREPKGKETEVNKITYKYTFVGWRVIRGTIDSWDGSSITGQFIQNTDIEAIYSVELLNIMPLPLAKDNLVTAKGVVPSAPELIKNIPGSQDKPLPDGTTIKYAPNGEPKVNEAGNTSAELLITYPNGSTTTITVPIKVVDDVVPQIGSEKPLVPENFVEVIVDTTDNATENTKFRKTFWVKPDTTVTLPVLAPTGKEIVEDGVRRTNHFKYWLSDNNKEYKGEINKEYKGEISDSFSSTRRKTEITAVYEFENNKEPVPNKGIKVPLNSKPSAKDFIKNAYDDGNPINKDNLPPGTRFEFANGYPDTSEVGAGKSTTIKITYPNGEVKEVPVSYEVSGDVVEQEYGKEKPDVPDSFVKVVIKADNKFYANGTELTKEEVDKLQFENLDEVEKTFWVDPTKEVTIKVQKAEKFKDKQNRTWSFNHWQVLDKYGNGRIYKTLEEITDKFTDINGTFIHAIYSRDDVEVPGEKDLLITELGVEPTAEQYKANLKAPAGKTIEKVEIITPPDVSRTGMTSAKLKVTYDDKTEAEFIVKVFVKDRYDPRPSEPQIIYRDRIVEKEKIVEKIVKIKDDERLKELRYMQGFSGKFRPYDGLRRAEAAQILANALKADAYIYDPNYAIDYKDVGNTWYTEAVRIVSQAGVFQGYSDGTFRPEGKITRAEWIATLRRFQNLKKVNGNDMGLSMNHWATEEIEAAYQAGWLEVYTSGIASFDYNKPITRQEVAAISNKAFDRVLDKVYLYRNSRNMIDYIDVDNKMPLYEDILCASNTLLTDGKYYKANAIGLDDVTFNIVTDMYRIYQKKFQLISH